MQYKRDRRITIIGAGSWGTTLGIVLSNAGVNVELHSVFKEHNIAMQKSRENRLFLKGVKFPSSLRINFSLRDSLRNEVIMIAIPVKFIRKVLKRIKAQDVAFRDKILISVSKGIESKTLMRVSEIAKNELGISKVAVFSGPNIAKEVLAGIPSAAVIACRNKNIGKKLQALLANPILRIYLHNDIVGVELGGALKNIIAISCGISDGLGFGANTKAALVTRGLVEITRLGKKLGARPSTFWGISGLGDLVTTCFSEYSRNRHVGEEIAKGRRLSDVVADMNMVAEGVDTVKSAFQLGKKMKVDMPITREVFSVLYKRKSPQRAVEDLMVRPLREENIL